MNWYCKLLAKKPQFVIFAIGLLSIVCIALSVMLKRLPNFDDPTLGFEARGTNIGQKNTAWNNLLEETKPFGSLIANPIGIIQENGDKMAVQEEKSTRLHKYESKKKKKKSKNYNKKIKIINEISSNGSPKTFYYNSAYIDEFYGGNDTTFTNNLDRHWEYGHNLSYTSDEETNKTKQSNNKQWLSLRNFNPPTPDHNADTYFCDNPTKDYAHFVVQRTVSSNQLNESLFDLKSLLGICELEYQLSHIRYYDKICQREVTSSNCCKIWSLPNYVALLSNKSSCLEIDEYDVLNVTSLLLECYQYFNKLQLGNNCLNYKCRVPVECAKHNAVYNMLHYLSNIDFIKINDTHIFLNASMIFVPIARSTAALPFYHQLIEIELSNEMVTIVAMDMGIKNALFDESLLTDSWLIGAGGIFVIMSMWLYTASLFVTFMTVVAIIFSIGIGYFIYAIVFSLTFFPFMNLLAVIVVIGIGADDAFVFMKIWNCVVMDRIKSSGIPLTSISSYESNSSRVDTLWFLMEQTLKHAALSMLVTSITTSAAFYSSYISPITAVRCFGIFAGTIVLANYVLMITLLPAAVSVAERINCFRTKSFIKILTNNIQSPFKYFLQLRHEIEETIIGVIVNYSKLWIVIFGLIGTLSGVMTLYYPKLNLPDSPDFKLFISNHPFEVYDTKYKDSFWFEKSYSSPDYFKLPLRFVWGIKPVDQGNYLNPQSRGQLEFDPQFNISHPASQVWLLNFCRDLKNQSFYQRSYNFFGLLPHCFIENFVTFMERRCYDEMSEQDRTPCCEVSKFPFTVAVFDECLPQSISSIYETPREYFIPGVAGPKFSRLQFDNVSNLVNITPVVRALVVEYDSTQFYTMSYTELEKFVQDVEEWMKEELKAAPEGMRNGWFTSDLQFYDLQETLSSGTMVAIGLSMSIALLVLLLVTLNVLISLYAIITVTFTIFSSIAVLILLGWRLNVLESVTVTTAIGLSVDFSLHYGVQYRLSPDLDRTSSTRFSLERMVGPTAMAAITTGAAGAFMLPSNVLAYIQIGIFLITIMTTSWLFSTFFLMSLLRLIGPEYGFGQFQYPKLRNSTRDQNKITKNHVDVGNRVSDPNQCTVSEQLLSASSSAAGDLIGSESHELDALTSNSMMKPQTNKEFSRPMNFDRAFTKKNKSYPKEQSPSTVSAITVVMPDDSELNN